MKRARHYLTPDGEIGTQTFVVRCVICGSAEATGRWHLCDGCRRKLVEKQRRHLDAIPKGLCYRCRERRALAGTIYCPRCLDSFDGGAGRA